MKQEVEHIVFDLGGVLLNIDLERISVGFAKLMTYTEKNADQLKYEIIPAYETGRITTDAFLNHLSAFLKPGFDKNSIAEVWNSIILDLPAERLHLLVELRKKYNVHLLSNINDLHARCFEEHFKGWFNEDPRNYFDRFFYSHEIMRRKPDVATFEWVINQLGGEPQQILFIDDMPENVEGAKLAGIQAYRLRNQEIDVIQLVKEELSLLG